MTASPSLAVQAVYERLGRMPSWLLAEANLYGHRLLADQLREEGLRGQHYVVLAGLAGLGGAGAPAQAELCRLLGIDRSDMAALLADLERFGYVRRARCPTDRRRNGVGLTDAGREALERLDRLVDAADRTLLEPLSAGERGQLIELLSRLVYREDGSQPQR